MKTHTRLLISVRHAISGPRFSLAALMRVIIPVSFGLLLSVPAAALTPSISSISPNPVPGSNSDELITISGSNFQSGVTLTFHDTNGTAYPSVSSKLTFVSATEVTYELNDAIDSGTWTVYATNPGGLTSSTVNFNVAAAALTQSGTILAGFDTNRQ